MGQFIFCWLSNCTWWGSISGPGAWKDQGGSKSRDSQSVKVLKRDLRYLSPSLSHHVMLQNNLGPHYMYIVLPYSTAVQLSVLTIRAVAILISIFYFHSKNCTIYYRFYIALKNSNFSPQGNDFFSDREFFKVAKISPWNVLICKLNVTVKYLDSYFLTLKYKQFNN